MFEKFQIAITKARKNIHIRLGKTKHLDIPSSFNKRLLFACLHMYCWMFLTINKTYIYLEYFESYEILILFRYSAYIFLCFRSPHIRRKYHILTVQINSVIFLLNEKYIKISFIKGNICRFRNFIISDFCLHYFEWILH